MCSLNFLHASIIYLFCNNILFFCFFLFSASMAAIIKKVPAATIVELILHTQITLLWISRLLKNQIKKAYNKNYWMIVYVDDQMNHVIITTNLANYWESDKCNKQCDFIENSAFLVLQFFHGRTVHSVHVGRIMLLVNMQP